MRRTRVITYARRDAVDPVVWGSPPAVGEERERKKGEGFRRSHHEAVMTKYRKNWIGSRMIPETFGLKTTVCGDWNRGR